MLALVIAPDPIFNKKAPALDQVTDHIRAQISHMFSIMYDARGIGLAAPMVGLSERIIIVDIQDGFNPKIAMINPEIIKASEAQQTFEEASLSYPGISADITRPATITVTYRDTEGHSQTLDASGWFAQVIQHEMDYLDGKSYLDHLTKIKRDRLLKKMEKYKKSPDYRPRGLTPCQTGCCP